MTPHKHYKHLARSHNNHIPLQDEAKALLVKAYVGDVISSVDRDEVRNEIVRLYSSLNIIGSIRASSIPACNKLLMKLNEEEISKKLII